MSEMINKDLIDLLNISNNISLVIHNVRDITGIISDSSTFVEKGCIKVTILNPIDLGL